MHNKPLLVLKHGDMYKFMFDTKLCCPVDCYHDGLGIAYRIKMFMDRPELLEQLAKCEREWFDKRIAEMKFGWKKLFEEIL
jgi:hypothetical protein